MIQSKITGRISIRRGTHALAHGCAVSPVMAPGFVESAGRRDDHADDVSNDKTKPTKTPLTRFDIVIPLVT